MRAVFGDCLCPIEPHRRPSQQQRAQEDRKAAKGQEPGGCGGVEQGVRGSNAAMMRVSAATSANSKRTGSAPMHERVSGMAKARARHDREGHEADRTHHPGMEAWRLPASRRATQSRRPLAESRAERRRKPTWRTSTRRSAKVRSPAQRTAGWPEARRQSTMQRRSRQAVATQSTMLAPARSAPSVKRIES